MGITSRKQEERACEIAAIAIGEKIGSPLSLISKPDEFERMRPAVDGLYSSSNGLFFLEHTKIESFRSQLWEASRFDSLIPSLIESLTNSLKLKFDLNVVFDVGFIKSLKRDDPRLFWLKNKISEANESLLEPDSDYGFSSESISDTIPGTQKQISIYKSQPFDNNPQVRISRFAPADWKKDLQVNMQERLADKFPKLQRACIEEQTIFVIEMTEVALSSWFSVFEAYKRAVQKQATTNRWEPDWVVIVHLISKKNQFAVIVKDTCGYKELGAITRNQFCED